MEGDMHRDTQDGKEPIMHHNQPETTISTLIGDGSESVTVEHHKHLGADHHEPALATWEDDGGAVA